MIPMAFCYKEAFLLFKWNNGRSITIKCVDGTRRKKCSSIKQVRRFYKAWSRKSRKV